MKISGYEVKTIFRDEITGNCFLQDTDTASAADFLHISKVLFDLGYTSYTDENGRPHFKKQDTENKLTTFVVFDPYLEV